jgi:quercetin dioxygenase-like cupin family protein
MTANQLTPIRRVVTGHDKNGVAKAVIDDVATNERVSRPGSGATMLWCTDEMPCDISIGEDIEDLGARTLGTPPPVNGTRLAIREYAPGGPGRMHRTETLDYVIILSGEVDMEMDEGSSVHLKAGDVVIQRGTYHSWINRGTETCRVAFVLVDAKPLGIGHPVLRPEEQAQS